MNAQQSTYIPVLQEWLSAASSSRRRLAAMPLVYPSQPLRHPGLLWPEVIGLGAVVLASVVPAVLLPATLGQNVQGEAMAASWLFPVAMLACASMLALGGFLGGSIVRLGSRSERSTRRSVLKGLLWMAIIGLHGAAMWSVLWPEFCSGLTAVATASVPLIAFVAGAVRPLAAATTLTPTRGYSHIPRHEQ